MRSCIILRRTEYAIDIVVKDTTGKKVFENYNDAIEWAKIDTIVQKTILGPHDIPKYSILYLDELGGITFDEVGNVKILKGEKE